MTIPKKNWLEWTVFAGGLLLLLAVSGYLLYEALTIADKPAALSVSFGEAVAAGDPHHFTVPISIRNDGGQTAAEVDVEVVLLEGDRQVERRELTFDFVPHMSSRSGALTFDAAPSPGQLRARVLTYVEP